MPSVLICASHRVLAELTDTMLWRDDVERQTATNCQQAFTLAVAEHPDLVVLECAQPGASQLVADLRSHPSTRFASIAVLASREVHRDEVTLLGVGANAILRPAAGRYWDARLAELMQVPGRRALRMPVALSFKTKASPESQHTTGMAVNLSTKGLLLESQGPLSLGVDIDLSFVLPDSRGDLVAHGEVVRRDPWGRYGIQFDRLEAEGAERIRAFVS